MSSTSETYETLFAVLLFCSGVLLGTYATEPEKPKELTPEEVLAKSPKCYVLPWEVPAKARLYEEKE